MAFLDTEATPITLPITGMTCAGCARRVETALRGADGVVRVDVNSALERADVAYDAVATTPERLVDAVRLSGFGVREVRTRLAIAGMTSATAASRAERALRAVPGVITANADLASDAVEVRLLPDADHGGALVGALERAGLQAEAGAPAADLGADAAAAARRDLIELAVAALLSLPLVLQMVAMALDLGWHLPAWLELVLAAPVQFWIGRRFYSAAWRALQRGAGNMDQLVVLGTSAAFFYSCWLLATQGMAASGQLYFEAAAVIITLVLTGKVLEARAKRSASAALRELMALRPAHARLLRAGDEREVPIADVVVGDIAVVKPGERMPVDGTIVRGESEVDESLITGESLPVLRGVGDDVVAGAINGPGLLRVRAERIGADTTLAKVAALVAQAQVGKAPIQKLVDRISAVFVPLVVVIAIGTFAAWLALGQGVEPALIAAVSVLVIACPCALGLATPAALVAGTGAAARAGILVRDVDTLERAVGVDLVVFDKTGTLTEGRPEVRCLVPASGVDEADLLSTAAAAQRGSEHPLARAVLEAAAARSLPLAEPGRFEAKVGQGVEAEVEGRLVRVGRATLAGSDPALADAAAAGEADGLTMVWVARDLAVLGLIGLADGLRPNARAAVATLQARGVGCQLLTGDNRGTAERIAAELRMDAVEAEVAPAEKAARVAELGRRGNHVAMVGDGVNDAPALAAADVGIAMGSGADVALESAGITLMRSDPLLVPAAFSVASKTRRKIRQNLFWAFIYNVVGIPIAALGLLSPAIAGAAMAASSVCVVSNALLLKRWTPEQRG